MNVKGNVIVQTTITQISFYLIALVMVGSLKIYLGWGCKGSEVMNSN